MKTIISVCYSLIDNVRYLFLGQRTPLNRPIFLFDERIRFFVKKYGQNGNHYSFQSNNKEEEKEFIHDYFIYLSYIKPKLRFSLNENSITVVTKTDRVEIKFSNRAPCFVSQGIDGSSGAGVISLTLESGLLV